MFQTENYWPLWDYLKIYHLLPAVLIDPDTNQKYTANFINRNTFSLLHWVVLMLFYRLKLERPDVWWDGIDVNKHVSNVLCLTDPNDLTKVVKFLASMDGCRIFSPRSETPSGFIR